MCDEFLDILKELDQGTLDSIREHDREPEDELLIRRMIRELGALERGEIRRPDQCEVCNRYAHTEPRRDKENILYVCEGCEK